MYYVCCLIVKKHFIIKTSQYNLLTKLFCKQTQQTKILVIVAITQNSQIMYCVLIKKIKDKLFIILKPT